MLIQPHSPSSFVSFLSSCSFHRITVICIEQELGVIHSKWVDPLFFLLGSAGTAASAQRSSVFPPVHAPAAAQQCSAAQPGCGPAGERSAASWPKREGIGTPGGSGHTASSTPPLRLETQSCLPPVFPQEDKGILVFGVAVGTGRQNGCVLELQCPIWWPLVTCSY